ncbi:MAG: hypothetical protein ACFBZ8_13515 [Opitutales bacterium]
MKSLQTLLILFVLTAGVHANDQPVVLYLYGDVAADGSIPSGDQPPFHQMRLNDEGARGMSQFRAAIEAAGFEIREAYDQDFEVKAETLEPLSVLILGSNQRRFSDTEAEALRNWVEQGGGVIAWSDSAFGGHFRQVGLGNPVGRDSDNDLMEQFGMFFMTDNGAGNYLIGTYTENHFLNRGKKDGGLRFRGEGVSPVRVSEPARMLARMQDGGLGGRIVLNQVDGKIIPSRDAALAVAEVGLGRVVGVFDRNLFWNAGEGTRLSHSDNREFAQRLVLWASGSEDESRLDNPEPADAVRNFPPKVEIQAIFLPEEKAIECIARVVDDDEDGITPEVTWRVRQKVEQTAQFVNNNPNGERVRILVKDSGDYQLVALVRDGEYVVRKAEIVKVLLPEDATPQP